MEAAAPAAKRAKVEATGSAGAAGVPSPPQPFLTLGTEANANGNGATNDDANASASAEVSSSAFEEGMRVITDKLVRDIELKDQVLVPCRALRKATEGSFRRVHLGEVRQESLSASGELLTTLLTTLQACPEWMRTMNQTSDAIASYVALECLFQFLSQGTLKSKRALAEKHAVTSMEYLCGVLRFADEVETYAIGRAMWKDVRSVQLCSEMTQALLQVFLEFNFRNGPIRRRYDGLKYRVKKLENILYELSSIVDVDAASAAAAPAAAAAAPTAAPAAAPAAAFPAASAGAKEGAGAGTGTGTGTGTGALVSHLLDGAEFAGMSKEIDVHTEARDVVIKAARDPQKDSKKAIYNLHRNNLDEARRLLEKSAAVAVKTAEETSLSRDELHAGSFGNALEEYAEARIFEEWLVNGGKLLPLAQLQTEVDIEGKDYLGGLVDFTGEIGRYGVARATVRDVDAVKKVLMCMMAVKEHAISMQDIGNIGKLSKKLEAVSINEKKMANTLYELILLTSSKRRSLTLASTSNDEPMAPAQSNE